MNKTWMPRFLPGAGWMLLSLLLTGCQPTREPPPSPVEAPVAPTAASLPPGHSRLEVATDASLLQAFVYRDGPLARLGHNHVVSSAGLSGEVVLDAAGNLSRLLLVIPVASLEVDRPELRSVAGPDFPGEVPEADREGTRQNLLGEALLDAARYPEIRLASSGESAWDATMRLPVEVTVRGVSHALTIPVTATRDGRRLTATGEFSLRHAELGLTPFTVMGGLLSVRDEIRLRFEIVAAASAD